MDVRRNFTKMDRPDRQRVINAIKWMKDNERDGVNGAHVTPHSTKGGVYQRYVAFHSQGRVTADLSDFLIGLTSTPGDTLHSIVIDNEEWVSKAKHPVTEDGLRAFLNDIPLSGGGQATGGPFNVMSVLPVVVLDTVIGQIGNSPFADIKIRTKPSGSTTTSEFAFTRTVTGAQYVLGTYQMAHRSPAFLPWHRVFLRMFEKDLQFADKQNGKDGKITLPYWNWMHDTDWDETSETSVWHKENFGGFSDPPPGTITGDNFSSSPPSTWKLYSVAGVLLPGAAGQLARRPKSQRTAPGGAFPTVAAAKPVVNNDQYIDETTIGHGFGGGGGGGGGNHEFAGGFEHELHDVVHPVVGGDVGQMSDALFSPQDPIFWLFHCNVDRIWSRWQWFYDKALPYPKFGMLPGRRRHDAMQPWAVVGPADPPYIFNVQVDDVLNAANFSSAVNSTNLLGKGYQYDSLKL